MKNDLERLSITLDIALNVNDLQLRIIKKTPGSWKTIVVIMVVALISVQNSVFELK